MAISIKRVAAGLLVALAMLCTIPAPQAKAQLEDLMGIVGTIAACGQAAASLAGGVPDLNGATTCLAGVSAGVETVGEMLGNAEKTEAQAKGETGAQASDDSEEDECKGWALKRLACEMNKTSKQLMEATMGYWHNEINIGDNATGVQNIVYTVSVALFVCSFMVGGARLAASRKRGLQDGVEEIGEVVGRWLIFSFCVPIIIPGATKVSDAMASEILSQFGATTDVLVASADLGDGTTFGNFMVVILALISIVGSLMQIVALLIRLLVLPIAVGLAPAFAAASFTESGKSGLNTVVAYIIAAIIFKPISAIFYCVIAWNITGSTDESFTAKLINVLMIAMAGFVIPTLVKALVPMTAQAGGQVSAGAVMGAAGATLGVAAGSIAGPGSQLLGAAAGKSAGGTGGAAISGGSASGSPSGGGGPSGGSGGAPSSFQSGSSSSGGGPSGGSDGSASGSPAGGGGPSGGSRGAASGSAAGMGAQIATAAATGGSSAAVSGAAAAGKSAAATGAAAAKAAATTGGSVTKAATSAGKNATGVSSRVSAAANKLGAVKSKVPQPAVKAAKLGGKTLKTSGKLGLSAAKGAVRYGAKGSQMAGRIGNQLDGAIGYPGQVGR